MDSMGRFESVNLGGSTGLKVVGLQRRRSSFHERLVEIVQWPCYWRILLGLELMKGLVPSSVLVTTSKALVTRSDALVTSSFLHTVENTSPKCSAIPICQTPLRCVVSDYLDVFGS